MDKAKRNPPFLLGGGLYFISPTLRLPDTITHAWIKLVRRTGLKNIRLHDTRHSHASLMLKHSVHPKVVQGRLGHASIQLTLDTYSHVAPGL
ncbi:MAG: tyrosine-type recombinase/integrase [Dehalococcoidia bacterium]